ncbi:hypothetical protein ACFOHS_02710 [Jhaorihella thermophila]
MTGEERDRAEAYLAEHLRPLRALAGDRSCADLVLGALSVPGGDDVMVVDGRPVIVNWGAAARRRRRECLGPAGALRRDAGGGICR